MEKKGCHKKLTMIAIVVCAVMAIYLWGVCGLSLQKTGNRAYHYTLPKELKQRIETDAKEFADDKDIVDYSFCLTNELLTFSEKNNISRGKANCIGYSQLFTSICNYALQVKGYEKRAKPVVGYVKWYGINLCKIARFLAPKRYKNFVKDHDFVELNYGSYRVYCSPTLNEMIWNDGHTKVD